MSNALFGPDGTQLPEPETVLPDALVSPSGQDAFVLPPLPELPPLPDADEVRRSFTDEFLATPPDGFPLPAAVAPLVPAPQPVQPAAPHRPTTSRRTARAATQPRPVAAPAYPPSGQFGPAGWQGQFVPPGQRPPPPRGYQPGPGQFLPQHGGGPPGYPPGFQPVPGHAQRPRDEPHNPLIQRRRRGSGGWVGCIVVLVFAVAVGFNAVQAIVTAVLDMIR